MVDLVGAQRLFPNPGTLSRMSVKMASPTFAAISVTFVIMRIWDINREKTDENIASIVTRPGYLIWNYFCRHMSRKHRIVNKIIR
jgi:hypothetical protein